MTPPRPPAHLHAAGRAYFRKITAEFDQGVSEQTLLTQAAEQLDIAEACRVTIAADGLTITTAKGVVKENPACATLRMSVRLFQSLVRQMAFDDEPAAFVPNGKLRRTPRGRALKAV